MSCIKLHLCKTINALKKFLPKKTKEINKHCYHFALLLESKIPLNDSFVKIVRNSMVINIQIFHCSFR